MSRIRTAIVSTAATAVALTGSISLAPSTTAAPGGCTTYASPGQSLDPLMERLSPGDVLCLKDGTYSDQQVSVTGVHGTADKRITVRAENEHKAVIDGKFQLVDPDHWTISGLRFTNPTPTNTDKRTVVILGGTDWVFERNEIWDGRYAGMLVGKSTKYGAPHDYVLRGNWIHDTDASNLYLNSGPDSTGGLVERNVFAKAGGNGSNTKLGWGGTGTCTGSNAEMYGIGEVEYRYNTLHGSRHPLTIAERGGLLNVRAHHNLITGSTASYSTRIDSTEGCLGDNVDVVDNAWAGTASFAWDAGHQPTVMAKMTGNVKLDPRFNNTTNGWTGFVPSDAAGKKYGHLAGSAATEPSPGPVTEPAPEPSTEPAPEPEPAPSVGTQPPPEAEPTALPTFKGAAWGTDDNAAPSTVLVTAPVGVATGDTLIAAVSSRGKNPTLKAPAGWTAVTSTVNDASNLKTVVWTKAYRGETGFTFSSSSADSLSATVAAYGGVTKVAPVASTVNRSVTRTAEAPGVLAEGPGRLLTVFSATGERITEPNGMQERAEAADADGRYTTSTQMSEQTVEAGSTGARRAALSGGSSSIGIALVVR